MVAALRLRSTGEVPLAIAPQPLLSAAPPILPSCFSHVLLGSLALAYVRS